MGFVVAFLKKSLHTFVDFPVIYIKYFNLNLSCFENLEVYGFNRSEWVWIVCF